MPDRVSLGEIGHVFDGVIRAGAASKPAPLRRQTRKKFQISDLKFQIEETATAKENSETPTRKYGVRLGGGTGKNKAKGKCRSLAPKGDSG
jgi:hypothetical protein